MRRRRDARRVFSDPVHSMIAFERPGHSVHTPPARRRRTTSRTVVPQNAENLEVRKTDMRASHRFANHGRRRSWVCFEESYNSGTQVPKWTHCQKLYVYLRELRDHHRTLCLDRPTHAFDGLQGRQRFARSFQERSKHLDHRTLLSRPCPPPSEDHARRLRAAVTKLAVILHSRKLRRIHFRRTNDVRRGRSRIGFHIEKSGSAILTARANGMEVRVELRELSNKIGSLPLERFSRCCQKREPFTFVDHAHSSRPAFHFQEHGMRFRPTSSEHHPQPKLPRKEEGPEHERRAAQCGQPLSFGCWTFDVAAIRPHTRHSRRGHENAVGNEREPSPEREGSTDHVRKYTKSTALVTAENSTRKSMGSVDLEIVRTLDGKPVAHLEARR